MQSWPECTDSSRIIHQILSQTDLFHYTLAVIRAGTSNSTNVTPLLLNWHDIKKSENLPRPNGTHPQIEKNQRIPEIIEHLETHRSAWTNVILNAVCICCKSVVNAGSAECHAATLSIAASHHRLWGWEMLHCCWQSCSRCWKHNSWNSFWTFIHTQRHNKSL